MIGHISSYYSRREEAQGLNSRIRPAADCQRSASENMLKFKEISIAIICILMGSVAGGYVAYCSVAKEKYDFGRRQGHIDGALEVIEFLGV